MIGSVNAEQRQLARYRVCSFAYARHLVGDIVELAGELTAFIGATGHSALYERLIGGRADSATDVFLTVVIMRVAFLTEIALFILIGMI